jgi:hypothetical protein
MSVAIVTSVSLSKNSIWHLTASRFSSICIQSQGYQCGYHYHLLVIDEPHLYSTLSILYVAVKLECTQVYSLHMSNVVD